MSTINNPRIFLWGALALVLFADYNAWMSDYPAPAAAPTQIQAEGGERSGHAAAPANELANRVPEAPSASPAASGSPPAGTAAPASAAASPASEPPASAADVAASAPLVHVRTDVLDLEISTRGGTLVQADLLQYPRVKGEATPVRLENDDGPLSLYELESGLAGPGSGPYPTHLALLSSAQDRYTLDGGTQLRVPLTWTGNGVSVTKTYVFRRGSYRIEIEYQVHNGGTAAWQGRSYAQILRNDPPTKRSYFNTDSYAFHGPAFWDGTKYRRLDVSDEKDSHLSQDVTDGWIAALQHFFVSAIVPPPGIPYRMTLSVAGEQFLLAASGPLQTIAPGESAAFTQTLFVGPKLQGALEATAPGLDRVTDYGRYLWVLARPLFLALSYVHKVSGNWGVAIIFVTFLLKLLFYPLSEASGRSMAKMKTLQPRIKNLQETYADDREKLGRAMMELYKREKINPVAGCLPIIIQIPVFIAFYWVLLESAEMRQAPFALWIHDLSARDPLFILPLIMAVAMFVQYKLNPAPPDPVQAKVFMIMPLVMSVTFAFFPAGLVLYWVTNTVLSIAQQWNINRRIAAVAAAKN